MHKVCIVSLAKKIMWYRNIVLFPMVILFYFNNNNNNNSVLLLLYILYKCKNMILSRYCVEKNINSMPRFVTVIIPMHLSVLLLDLKGTCYAPFYKMSNKSLISPECVCEALAQYTPRIIFIAC